MDAPKRQTTPHARAPHFVDPQKPGTMFAVAPGMRFRRPDGTVEITPPPTEQKAPGAA